MKQHKSEKNDYTQTATKKQFYIHL